jgi:hypothetical protein
MKTPKQQHDPAKYDEDHHEKHSLLGIGDPLGKPLQRYYIMLIHGKMIM